MTEKILFVDDEPAALDGYRRSLHREFEVETALGAAPALALLKDSGPYAVVISDMRMPAINGAEFLSQVRKICPETVRMLLTGYTEIGPAIEAVNQGNIFRFLNKPCGKEALVDAITSGVEQYRLITGEKELLEKTLLGSIKVLADVLSAASPEAFGRSMRIANYVRHSMTKLAIASPWQLEAAAALSQLGCVTLEPDLIQRAYAGSVLGDEDQARFNAHPESARQLLANIPRLEPVAWIICQQLVKDIPTVVPGLSDSAGVVLGAKVLKLAVAYEQLRMKISSREDILMRLRDRRTEFEPSLVNTLADFKSGGGFTMKLQKIPIARLRSGMVIDEEIKNRQGVLLVARGQEITSTLVMKLENFARAGLLKNEIFAFVPA